METFGAIPEGSESMASLLGARRQEFWMPRHLKAPTINSLAMSSAGDVRPESSESLGIQHQPLACG